MGLQKLVLKTFQQAGLSHIFMRRQPVPVVGTTGMPTVVQPQLATGQPLEECIFCTGKLGFGKEHSAFMYALDGVFGNSAIRQFGIQKRAFGKGANPGRSILEDTNPGKSILGST